MSFFERFVTLEGGQGPNSLFASFLDVDDLGSLSVACSDSKRFVEIIVGFNTKLQEAYDIGKFTHTISKDLILLLRNRPIQRDYKTHLRPIVSKIYKTLTQSQIDAIYAFYRSKRGSFVDLYTSMNTKFGELRSSTHHLRIPQSSTQKKHEKERNNSPPPEMPLIDEIFKTQFSEAGLSKAEMQSLILRIIHEHSAIHSSLRYFNKHPQTFTDLYRLMQNIEDASREKLRAIEQEHKQPDTPTLSQRSDSPHSDGEEHYVHLLPNPVRRRRTYSM